MEGKYALLIGAFLFVVFMSPLARWRARQALITLGVMALAGVIAVELVSDSM